MTSERRRLANQQNARKSTGPKSDAGKTRSRRNALKHGLTGAGIVMRRQDEKKAARRVADWRETLAPINPIEDTLVERAALAAVRCESAVEQEAAQRRRRIGKALSRFRCRKRKEVAAVLDLLQTEPGRAGRRLKELKRGVAWLIDEWSNLREQLDGHGYWTCVEAGLAFRLLGKDPALPYPGNPEVAAFRRAWLGALPELDLDAAEAILGLSSAGLDESAREAAVAAQLPDRDAARATLMAAVEAKLARSWQRQADLADDLTEDFEREEAVACAQIGTDLEAVRLHRYEFAQEMSLHRNLNELIRIRKQEPDLASIARWEKTGKKYNRRWDGYSWVPNSEWRLDEEDVARGAWRVAREDSELKAHEASSVSGPSLRSDPGTRRESVLSGELMSSRVPGAETESMPRLPTVEAAEPRAGVCSQEQPSPPVPGVERSDPPVADVRSELASSRGPDQEPAADDLSWATGGSLRSTPGTRPDGQLREEEQPGSAGAGTVMRSGSSLRSDPGTRSDADAQPDATEPQGPTRIPGVSALRDPGSAEAKVEPAEKPTTDGRRPLTEQTSESRPSPASHQPSPPFPALPPRRGAADGARKRSQQLDRKLNSHRDFESIPGLSPNANRSGRTQPVTRIETGRHAHLRMPQRLAIDHPFIV